MFEWETRISRVQVDYKNGYENEEDDELSHMSVQLPVYSYTDNELPFSYEIIPAFFQTI